MGQQVTVVEKRSSRPGIVRYETNRPLTGMSHEQFRVGDPVEGNRPVDELARRLFARGGIKTVHVNGSVVTIALATGGTTDSIVDLLRNLFRHY